jgi:hypothetical protein
LGGINCMCVHRPYVYGWVPLLLGCLAGCETEVTLTPAVSAQAPPTCVIAAPLSYDGQPAYLPQVITAEPAADHATVLRYSYDAQYNAKQQATALQPLNPLLIVGFPTGSNAITVSGVLEVLRDGKPVRAYAAACALKRTSTVFSEGETLTVMRRRALFLVRDDISAQICRDQQGLRALLAGDPPSIANKQPQ